MRPANSSLACGAPAAFCPQYSAEKPKEEDPWFCNHGSEAALEVWVFGGGGTAAEEIWGESEIEGKTTRVVWLWFGWVLE